MAVDPRSAEKQTEEIDLALDVRREFQAIDKAIELGLEFNHQTFFPIDFFVEPGARRYRRYRPPERLRGEPDWREIIFPKEARQLSVR